MPVKNTILKNPVRAGGGNGVSTAIAPKPVQPTNTLAMNPIMRIGRGLFG